MSPYQPLQIARRPPRAVWTLCVWALTALLAACQPAPPMAVGFMAGLTGRTTDLGVGGRDGATLAVEEVNASGGIAGRQVKLLVEDDTQDAEAAQRAYKALRAAGVELVIGPMTSAMAAAVVPLANEGGPLLLSPTVTTSELNARDDRFFRVIASTREYASVSARFQIERNGVRRVAAILDGGNQAFTQRWLDDFVATFEPAGGEVVDKISYTYFPEISFAKLAEQALRRAPDAVVLLVGAVDAAQLVQQLRKQSPHTPVLTTEWSATDQFITLAASAAEGVFTTQFLDRSNQSPAYVLFNAAFQKRFGRPPGFPELAAYDAANVALSALAQRQDGEDIKQTLLRVREFQGVQQGVRFDDHGDVQRATFVTVVRQGRFVVHP